MKKIVVFFISIIFISKIFAMDDFAANVAYEKAKSFVQKEEAIALAFKEYLLKNNKVPTLSDLVDNQFLNDGFSILNDFSKEIKITTILQDAYIENEINLDTKSITKFYDYYYSNNNRQHTLAPTTISSYSVKIKLSSIESFVLNNQASILVDILDLPLLNLTDKYYLKDGTLTWYDLTGTKKFTYNGRDIIIFGNEELSTTNLTIIKLLANNFLSVGSLIYMIDGDAVSQVMYLGQDIFKVMGGGEGIGETAYTNAKLLITPYSGGYLLNGDIYTWGNNENRIITINKDDYKYENKSEDKNVTIPLPVRLKVKSYDTNISNENYFSSPNRTQFIDFFASSENGTCAISEDYILYCTGSSGDKDDYLVPALDQNSDTEELLYKVTWFNGTLDEENEKYGKANKVIAIDKRWFVLSNGTINKNKTYDNATLYTFGEDDDGFAGNGNEKNDSKDETKPIQILNDNNIPYYFKDIAISYEKDYKKMFALDASGNVYLWGIDKENSAKDDCLQSISGISLNFCKPENINQIINNETKFVSLRSNSRGVTGITSSGEKYYIYQEEGKLPSIVKNEDFMKSHSDYNFIEDSEIIDSDMIASDEYKDIYTIWINKNNEIKGDFNILDLQIFGGKYIFIDRIKSNKWLKVKFIDEELVCAIDTNYQTYCWGKVGFDDNNYETIAIPIFNTNHFDSMVYDGDDVKDLELKYPTYISGFNYDFEFK